MEKTMGMVSRNRSSTMRPGTEAPRAKAACLILISVVTHSMASSSYHACPWRSVPVVSSVSTSSVHLQLEVLIEHGQVQQLKWQQWRPDDWKAASKPWSSWAEDEWHSRHSWRQHWEWGVGDENGGEEAPSISRGAPRRMDFADHQATSIAESQIPCIAESQDECPCASEESQQEQDTSSKKRRRRRQRRKQQQEVRDVTEPEESMTMIDHEAWRRERDIEITSRIEGFHVLNIEEGNARLRELAMQDYLHQETLAERVLTELSDTERAPEDDLRWEDHLDTFQHSHQQEDRRLGFHLQDVPAGWHRPSEQLPWRDPEDGWW